VIAVTTADVERMADLDEFYAHLRLGGTDASLGAIVERLRTSASPPSTGATSRSSAPRTSPHSLVAEESTF